MKVTALFCFLLFLQPASGQYNWAAMDMKVQSKKQLLGDNIVVMIWSKGIPAENIDSIVYKKEIGDFTSKTQAPIASCSKWLTAALVMQFVDEGKLSLDDKVSKYIRDFDNYFKKYLTIRQCLSHMAGIEDDGKLLKRLLQRRKFASLEEEVDEMMKVQNTKEQIKYAPKSASGYTYASGTWVIEERVLNNNKTATAAASPGLFGTWPMIDYCRGYAYIVFVKNFLGEERADVHRELKKLVDQQIKSSCR